MGSWRRGLRGDAGGGAPSGDEEKREKRKDGRYCIGVFWEELQKREINEREWTILLAYAQLMKKEKEEVKKWEMTLNYLREKQKKKENIKRKIRMTQKCKKTHCLKNFQRDTLIFLMHNDPGWISVLFWRLYNMTLKIFMILISPPAISSLYQAFYLTIHRAKRQPFPKPQSHLISLPLASRHVTGRERMDARTTSITKP